MGRERQTTAEVFIKCKALTQFLLRGGFPHLDWECFYMLETEVTRNVDLISSIPLNPCKNPHGPQHSALQRNLQSSTDIYADFNFGPLISQTHRYCRLCNSQQYIDLELISVRYDILCKCYRTTLPISENLISSSNLKRKNPHSLLIAADTSRTNQPRNFPISANDNGD